MGVGTHVLSAEPDGRNINLDCGSEHTAPLEGQVLEKAAHAGLAFDGDGDRLVAVDEKGKKLTGDQVMTILAKGLTERGAMSNPIVVSTVMSNLGFRLALKALDLRHVATQVGDRHVVEEMVRRGARLGGEDSGHIIFLDHHTTGDGLISALQLLYTMKTLGLPLSELSGLMTVYPQVLVNVPVTSKPEIHRVPEVAGVIKEAERALGPKGRVLVRFSGTEPVCRVMVEGEERSEITAHAQRIAGTIRKTLNP
jgi:phosphoglucosamine mutase